MKKIDIEAIADKILLGTEMKLSASALGYIKNAKKTDLIGLHHGLGTGIRNTFQLWKVKWKPKLVDGIDVSPNHPDEISMKIIEALWTKLQK